MAKSNVLRSSWLGGLVSPEAQGRVDLERMASTSEEFLNVDTLVLGGFTIRPGMGHLRELPANAAVNMEVFAASRSTASAILLFLPNVLEVEVGDAPVMRPAVTSTVTSGDFSAATGWTLIATEGASSDVDNGSLIMRARARSSEAKARQEVTTASPNVEHALRIIVKQGVVRFLVGSTAGGDDYIFSTTLLPGEHSLAFTPTGSFWIEFSTQEERYCYVDSCTIEAAGRMQIPTPWDATNLREIRTAQSRDVMFVACRGEWQYRIERRGERSWSVARYFAEDGPFTPTATSAVSLRPTVLTGNGSMHASGPFFRPGHVGALFRLFHSGQRLDTYLAGPGEASDTIRISGVGPSRAFEFDISGTYTGTITQQRSTDSEFSGFNNTPSTGEQIDLYANVISWRRIAFTQDYTSGVARIQMSSEGGGGYGIARVTDYISPTQVRIEVLRRFQQTLATKDWREGEWSKVRSLPSAVCFFDGRLAWGGDDQLWMSVSDAYASFDPEKTGDSGPIRRYVGSGGGGAYDVNGMLALQRLIVLTDEAEVSARSSSFDEALKPDGITLKDASSQGSARVAPVRVDRSGFYVQADGRRIYRLQFAAEAQDYASADMCELIPEIGEPGIVKLAVLRQPDTQIYALRLDGTLARLTYYFQDDSRVASWLEWETDGLIKDICVKPTASSEELHLIVQRTKTGGAYLSREKLAPRAMTKGGDNNRLADAFIWSTSPSLRTTVTGLAHLNGREVVVWGDGKAQARKTVSGGSITITAAKNVLVGLYYGWRNKSTKLAFSASAGTALLQKKRVEHVGLLLRDTHINGIRLGRSFDKMDGLPRVIDGVTQSEDTIFDEYDFPSSEFNGNFDTDPRLCMGGGAPYPVTVLAAVMSVNTVDKL